MIARVSNIPYLGQTPYRKPLIQTLKKRTPGPATPGPTFSESYVVHLTGVSK